MKKSYKKNPREFYEWLQANIFLTTIFLGLAPIYCSFLIISGKSGLLKGLFYKSEKNVDELKNSFFCLAIILIFFHLATVIIKALADRKNMISNIDGQKLFQILYKYTHPIVKKKAVRIKEFIDSNISLEKFSAYKSTSQPKRQIEIITDSLLGALSELFNIDSSKIAISYYYSKNGGDIEIPLHKNENTLGDIPIKKVIENQKSTLNYLLRHPELDYIFLPDKRKAIEEGKYIPCNDDNTYKNTGSILCKLFSYYSEQINVRVILTINTFGEQLCSENDPDSIEKLEKLISPAFFVRINLELELYFIKMLLRSRCLNCKGKVYEFHSAQF